MSMEVWQTSSRPRCDKCRLRRDSLLLRRLVPQKKRPSYFFSAVGSLHRDSLRVRCRSPTVRPPWERRVANSSSLTKRFVTENARRLQPRSIASPLFFDPGMHPPAHPTALFPGAKRCIQRVRIVRAGLTPEAPRHEAGQTSPAMQERLPMRVLLRVALTLLLAIPLCLALALFLVLDASRGVASPTDRAVSNSSQRRPLGPQRAAA
jgi:hypothetical protein